VAVAAGNALNTPARGDAAEVAGAVALRLALQALADHPSAVVREHVSWALTAH
jgi:epoxyqueuosine reductase